MQVTVYSPVDPDDHMVKHSTDNMPAVLEL
jgi:hypothetical protein